LFTGGPTPNDFAVKRNLGRLMGNITKRNGDMRKIEGVDWNSAFLKKPMKHSAVSRDYRIQKERSLNWGIRVNRKRQALDARLFCMRTHFPDGPITVEVVISAEEGADNPTHQA
jgi:hypothetical protein